MGTLPIAHRQEVKRTNEIKMAIPLLETLDIKGKEVSADALLTQRRFARYLVEERQALILSGLSRMAKGKAFIQLSYLRKGPVPLVPGGFTAEISSWVWLNIPPARVWLYRKV